MFNRGSIVSYSPPSWASSHLCWHPPSKMLLSPNLPTPIHRWLFRCNNVSFDDVFIKRDDMTESFAAGNKIRKLEFIMADALARNSDAVITVGGTGSNHARATVAMCRVAGVRPIVVLRKDSNYLNSSGDIQGNLRLSSLADPVVVLVSREFYSKHGQKKVLSMASKWCVKQGFCKSPYELPVGGSTTYGVFGYLECVAEMVPFLKENHIRNVFFSCGSGGTAAGLALGFHLCSLRPNIKLIGYLACDTPAEFYAHIQHELDILLSENQQQPNVKAEDLIELRGEYKGKAYGVTSEDELQCIREVASSSGIILDGTYTGKAVNGFVQDKLRGIVSGPSLFIHTGGMFGLFEMSSKQFQSESFFPNGDEILNDD